MPTSSLAVIADALSARLIAIEPRAATAPASIRVVHAPGRVKGDLTTPTLQIDKGVVFEGRSFMEAATSPKAAVASKPPAPPAGPTPVK